MESVKWCVCQFCRLLSCGRELTVNGSSLQTRKIATGFVKNGAKVEHSVELNCSIQPHVTNRIVFSVPQVYISSRTAKDCDETAKELNALGPGTCIPIPADMQKLSGVDKLVSEISSKEKVLHVLVNNAGAVWGDKFDAYPVRMFRVLVSLDDD